VRDGKDYELSREARDYSDRAKPDCAGEEVASTDFLWLAVVLRYMHLVDVLVIIIQWR